MSTDTIAILGAGQLGRMLALAGVPLGLRFRFLDPTPDSPASHVAPQLCGPYDDPALLKQFVADAQVITYEFENVSLETARGLEEHMPVFPPPAALEASQDRLTEKRFFQRLGAQTPAFVPVESQAELDAAIVKVGTPAVLKTRRMGYDGKGQIVVPSADEAAMAWQALGGQPLILEGFVDFKRELSIIAVRTRGGETRFYPLVENTHRAGILRRSIAPAPHTNHELQAEAEAIAKHALDTLGYVGVLAIELFETRGGHLIVNEMAPRVHNSGHWTIEGAETSQFENHVRAIAGMPLGETTPRGYSAMLNLIGRVPEITSLLAIPGAHLHLYGKAPRSGRKLGHLTLRADSRETLAKRVAEAETIINSVSDG